MKTEFIKKTAKKLTKREIIMIFVLFFAAFSFIYLRFLILPQFAEIKELKTELNSYKADWEKYQEAESVTKSLDTSIADLSHELRITEYFPAVEQEEIILLIEDFVKNPELQVPSISFSVSEDNKIGDVSLNATEVSINYKGSFEAITEFMNNVWNFQKKIIVNSLSIANNPDGVFTGNAHLSFYHLPKINIDQNNLNSLYEWNMAENSVRINPFEGYGVENSKGKNYIYRGGEFLLQYQRFNDIEGHWAEEEIDAFDRLGYIQGDGSGNYNPNEGISRGEFILLLDHVYKWTAPAEKVDLTRFEDYTNLGSYENSIVKAIHKGYIGGFVSGHDDNTLRPFDLLTYAELEMLMRKVLNDESFKWDQIAEKIRSEKGIVSSGLENKNNPVTKAEAVYFLFHNR